MAADCQIDSCGVLAIGRCQVCNRAFCGSHQARGRETRFVDFCSACQTREQDEKVAAAAADRQRFLDLVRACESQPFPRLLAGAVLRQAVDPPQATPWCLYDPKFAAFAPGYFDGELCERLANDFVAEAGRRDVRPERRVRSERAVTKGLFLPRKRWEKIYDEGWLIPKGSGMPSGGKSDGYFNAVIWTDADVSTDDPDRGGGRLREAALPAMARLLGINTTPQSG